MPGAAGQAAGQAAALDVRGITADSRLVAPGYVFAALPGARHDGRAFIAEAVERGAAAVLAPEGTQWPAGVPPRPLIEDAEPRRTLARIAARLAGPQPRTVVAVTGTNGKTSTVEFLRQLWTLADLPAASLGTLGLVRSGAGPAGAPAGAAMTTPDPVALARTLAELARAQVDHVALEASSHGLDQFRLDGVRLRAAAFTNLTRDHLDYHGTLDAYRAAKLRLFAELLPAGAPVVAGGALDEASLQALRGIVRSRRLDLRTALVRAIRVEPWGMHVSADLGDGPCEVALNLAGAFQAENAVVAAALACVTGLAGAAGLLPRLAGVRGRMEHVATLAHGAAAYVDYAHTPDALDRLLAALRPHAHGRLHIVFGAGGDRDPGKRGAMGAAAAAGADRAIVTDDNPRTEDPAAIRAAVLAGCPGAIEIGDRAAAIAAGLAALRPGDVLVVAGKGHEQGQTIGDAVLPFDDAAVIRRLAGAA